MQLFGRGNRNLVQRLTSGDWRNDDDKAELLAKFQDSAVKAVETIPMLWSDDPSVRRVAASEFSKRANAKDTAKLLEDLQQEPQHHRSFALRMLAHMAIETVKPAVDEALASPQAGRQRMGWEAAFMLGINERRPYLERGVTESPPAMRLQALQALVRDVNPQQLLGLLLPLVDVEDIRVRTKVVEALATVRSPEVFTTMVTRFQLDQGVIRETASRYLREYASAHPAQVKTRVLDMLAQGDDGTRHLSVEILMNTGRPDEVLAEVLEFSHGLAPWIRQRILDTLQTMGDQFLKASVELLSHAREEIRNAALILAEQFNDPRVVGPICGLLTQSDDWWTRVAACDTLAKLKDERSVPSLVAALKDPDTRWAALDALASIGSNQALNPIASMVRDEDASIRLEAVQALDRFDDTRVLGLLQQVAAQDLSVDVRTRAVEVSKRMAERMNMEDQAASLASGSRHRDASAKPIDWLLTKIRDAGASDLHLTPGDPPFVRHFGKLERMEGQNPLSAEQIQILLESMLTPRQRKQFEDTGDLDFCYTVPEVGRYRGNAYSKRLGLGVSFRVIPNLPPTFNAVGLPGHLTELLNYHQGIIIVAGPAGSGKSTTLAAIINLINESKSTHVVTLEDPVEFIHPAKLSLVNQREIGTHSDSFARALRGALRQDPDVIMVGELRDAETARMSLEAAETGHLVITTMPTTSAVATIERLVGSFPPDEQDQIRISLSEALKFVISQNLLPRMDGKGRCGVFEILKGTMGIAALIRDNKTLNIPSMMQIGRNVGMQTVDMALEDLVDAGAIAPETAYMRASKPEVFAPRCSPAFLESLDFS